MNTEENWQDRTILLLGQENIKKLSLFKVAVFGLGGVGGYVVESLARVGIGNLDIIDNDAVTVTNLNRQIFALKDTLGKMKTDVARERILNINPKCNVNVFNVFYLPENQHLFDFSQYDYIVDAVDTVSAKINLAENADRSGVKLISAMGAGNKLNPLMLAVSDIYDTSVCPLARVMRYECRKRNIQKLKVVYSKERPVKTSSSVPGSVSFVPSAMGMIIAYEVIKDLLCLN